MRYDYVILVIRTCKRKASGADLENSGSFLCIHVTILIDMFLRLMFQFPYLLSTAEFYQSERKKAYPVYPHLNIHAKMQV